MKATAFASIPAKVVTSSAPSRTDILVCPRLEGQNRCHFCGTNRQTGMSVLPMYFIYSLLLGLGFLILLPRFLLDALRHGKYVVGFRERWGSLTPLAQNIHPVFWIHCVSVGETQTAVPLVHGLKARFPHARIVISTITLTGQ